MSQLDSTLPNSLTLTIEDKCPSINDIYSGKHWGFRKRIADEKHELVKWAVYTLPNKGEYNLPIKKCTARYEVWYKGKRRHDNTNAFIKLYEDGLTREGIIIDDNSSCVTEVTVAVKTDMPVDKVIITLYVLD